MISIRVEGLKQLQAELKDFSERRLKAAAATALTRTAVQARNEVAARLPQVFDNPTPYTQRQLRYVAATAQKPVAVVGFNVVGVQDIYGKVISYRDLGPGETPAGKYLQFQMDGGQRQLKRFEVALQRVGALPPGWFAVPGQRASVNAYGNQSIGELRQILSWLDAAELVAGSRQNMGPAGRDKRRKGTRKRAGFEYFVVNPGDRRSFVRSSGGTGTHRMQPGVYRRTFTAFGDRIEPVIIFVRRATYRPRFDFNGMVGAVVARDLQPQIDRAIAEAAARLAGKGQA